MTYLENTLNQYDTYTYDISLHMVHPSQLSQRDGAIGSGILIAKNSVESRYNISTVEQTYSVGHGLVREALGSMFQITIQELNGVTLLTKIKESSLQLSIPSHLHAGYIISIEFNGRTSDGVARKHPQRFYFPVIFRHMTFKVTEGGTVYNIEAIESGQIGYQYSAVVIRDQITIVARTVGEFFDQFEEKFSDSMLNAWAANPAMGFLMDTYRFEFDPSTEDWRRWRFQALDEAFESDGANFIGSVQEGDPALQVIINNGSNFTAIVGQVLALTREYKNIVSHDGGYFRNEPHEQTNRQLSSFPVFFKIITNVEFGEFDPGRNEYQRNIIYKLKAYVVPQEILDINAYQTTITDPGAQATRYQNLISGGFLRKRYDYYYTGRNTEVLEFDMQFNNAYYYAMPYGDGYFGDPDVLSPQFIQDNPEVIGRFEQLRQSRQNLANAARNANILSNQPAASFDGGLFSALRGISNTQLQNFRTEMNDYQNFLQTNFNYSPAQINHQVRFVLDAIGDQDTSSSDNDRRSGMLKFGAVKMNLESAADLVQIELGVRGDPYWLGVPNSLYNAQQDVDNLADYEAGTRFFFLNVNFPISDEDAAGQRPPQPDYQLTSLYAVNAVINRFDNGQFVQYLRASIDNVTNVNTIGDRLNSLGAQRLGIDRAGFGERNIDPAQAQENARSGLGE